MSKRLQNLTKLRSLISGQAAPKFLKSFACLAGLVCFSSFDTLSLLWSCILSIYFPVKCILMVQFSVLCSSAIGSSSNGGDIHPPQYGLAPTY